MSNTKAMNPEARLQASVARDIKIRHMNEHAKHQADALSVAKWELALHEKDKKVQRQRLEDQMARDSEVVKVISNASRRERLAQLYKDDELKYEEELNLRGLSFRRERI